MRLPAALALLLLAGVLCGCLRPEAGAGPAGPPPTEPALLAAVPAGHTGYDNASLARLFVALTMQTEWGARRPVLVRYEEPVRVGVEGPAAARLTPFLLRYLDWLRIGTGIDIGPAQQRRNLTVRLVPGAAFAALLPGAACVLVPGAPDWPAFAAQPDTLGGRALVQAQRLEAMTVFVPDSAAPAEQRACLIEEIAQALGPVNDLYGLGPSVFNDDFGHLWPTRLDLLMLRVLYDPEMATGLDAAEAERRALGVLNRINPAGRTAPALPPVLRRDTAPWEAEVARILSRRQPMEARQRAAASAADYARSALPGTPWHCQALTLRAQVTKFTDPEAALEQLAGALALCTAVHGPQDPRIAQLRLVRAGVQLSLARPQAVLEETEGLAPALAAHGLEAALAAHYGLRARAFAAMDRAREARAESARAAAWQAHALGWPSGGS